MRFDFHRYLGIDIDDFFLGTRNWVTFVELVGELPRGGNYGTAVLDDDDMLQAQIEAFGPPEPAKRPPLKGWGPLQSNFADVKDLLNVLISVSARSDKPVRPQPRPETSFDRYEAAERKKNSDHLNALLGIVSSE